MREGLGRSGAAGFAVIGGARLTNESAYAWAKLAKGVIGSDNVDAQLGDGLPAEVVIGLPKATIDEVCRPGGTVIWLGPDPKEELGVLYIRMKHAIVEDGAKLIEITPTRTGLSKYAAATLTYRAGEAAAVVEALLSPAARAGGAAGLEADQLSRAADLIAAANGPVTVVLGRASIAESAATIVDAAALLAEGLDGVRFLSAVRRANVHGAIDLGLAPGLLPGRVTRSEGAAWFGAAWPTVPAADGLDTAGILQAAADGKIDTLVLLGADPLADFPDRELAERALTGARCVIAIDQFLNESAQRADVVFAAAGFGEVQGTTTNLEGRVTVLNQKVTPVGTSRADWMIAAGLADRLGADFGCDDVSAIWDEIEELSVLHAGLTSSELAKRSNADGVVVPLAGPETQATADGEDLEDGAEEAAASSADAPDASAESEGADEGADDLGEPVDDGLVAAPQPLIFAAGARTAVPPVDAYALRLVASRSMYDNGTLLQHSHSSAGLSRPAVLRLNPFDFDRVGVAEGGRVKVTNGSRSIVVEAASDASLPKGTAALMAGAGNVAASALVDAADTVAEVRLEAAR